jgi:phosphoribosylformimino-5-aminoimidazole carboxamide ribotide isomerase
MQLIPAIDILDGKCVRLLKGDYNQATYYPVSPLVYARMLEDAGISHLHLVDLEGARSGNFQVYEMLGQISNATKLKVDTGGGIRTFEAIEKVLQHGATQVNLGSIAQQQPEQVSAWIPVLPTDSIIIGADVREGLVATHGWLAESNTRVEDLIGYYLEQGLSTFTVTDIGKDGTLKGPAVGLYKDLLASFPQMKLIASGGVGSVKDLDLLALTGCHGVIIGKALFEGNISLEELSLWNKNNG